MTAILKLAGLSRRADLLDLAGNSEQQRCEPRRGAGLLVSPGFLPNAPIRNQHGFDA
jgi:hypothetical protein